jgi:serine/threonine protein kinase
VLSKLTQFFSSGSSGPRNKKLPRIDVAKRFDLLGRTGQGSMSKVYRAFDRNLGRTVCLKVLDKEKTAKFEARFSKTLKKPIEGAVCSELRHQNIVQTYEYGYTNKGEQYIVMELIDGMGLNFLIETRSPQLKAHRINFLLQTCDALGYMHQQGFLHRDMCPRNIMVTKENVVKLIDFGLSVPLTPVFCAPGNRTGTPNYLAPELIKRVPTDQRLDLFALGVTAYELYTGTLPWESSRSLDTLQKHLNLRGRDPLEAKPDLDPRVAKLLTKAIEREPRDRYQTAAEFRDALRMLPKETS